MYRSYIPFSSSPLDISSIAKYFYLIQISNSKVSTIKDGCLRIGWRMDIIYWNLEFGKRVSVKRTTVYGARRSDERLSDRWVTRWMILEEDKAKGMERHGATVAEEPFRGDAWLTEEDEPNGIFDVSEKPETNEEQIRDRWGKDIVRGYLER